jgi:hypothetical protein
VHVCVCVTYNIHRTLQERAQRLYATKGRRLDTLDASMFATKKATTDEEVDTKQRELAFMEAQVYHYVEMLSVCACVCTQTFINYRRSV